MVVLQLIYFLQVIIGFLFTKPELAQTKPCISEFQLPSLTSIFPEFITQNKKEHSPLSSSSLASGSPGPTYRNSPVIFKIVRNRISDNQSKSLWVLFKTNPYPNTNQRNKLANKLGLSARVVQVWFQNRRQALKEK